MVEWIKENPYGLDARNKSSFLLQQLTELTRLHYEKCQGYRQIINAMGIDNFTFSDMESMPFIPVRLFKMLDLVSVNSEEIIKTLTSSGTTSQVVSRIFLNKETSILQTKALVNIVTSFIGTQRLPMILVDAQHIVSDRKKFSARGAGLMGLVNFGRDHFYLLDENMEVRWAELDQFMSRHHNQPILIFGFTFMIWKYFYQAIKERNYRIHIPRSILIHSGGWKKMLDEAVTPQHFNQSIKDEFSIERIINFYGMVEQVGSIYMECEAGYLHAPTFADIMIRHPLTYEPQAYGQQGLIQTVSVLPRSYPGHNLLTEDLGTIYGEDNCPCGRKGKYFRVHGRLPAAELRGCSDTFAYRKEVTTR
ncbi:acyl-protein synthetase [Paenibacillus melissococcoides]|uniref:Acyl-protein synthetase n=1 Tax=Paenibacillus melissococcoides TaxID=2912268 RepID=A0ABN8UH46_9BACL|nr:MULTISPECIES: acyl-protein synthetase [Paenibacillus]MEB9894628.1 acyl-protein synthetase [Bacillus cereus]CAH8248890.1 acyl-protein synthetase [Paenibacillus melissococcoides]CAH8720704.1 acyl-protein synthetase [Paenibacillus melissococcoides]CAH8720935.1 acyl-protein synthetase [Paenibacillus melissococcoides]GIO79222.1 acyl-protein synthetase [Paenibacillus dendritiformis]